MTASLSTLASVLVVEDHDELRKSLVAAIRRSGFSASGVFCAEEVNEAAQSGLPDIYVIDIGLPGEDGLSLSVRIRERHPQAGIVLLTARTAPNARIDGYNSGADVYLGKPVDAEELLAVLRSMARRLHSGRREQDHDLVLDTDANLLLGPAARIPLSEAEKRALTRFALSPQRELERWELMEAFGSIEAPISPRSMEVRIATLRKKTADALGNATNPILGLRGSGYRLRPRLRFK